MNKLTSSISLMSSKVAKELSLSERNECRTVLSGSLTQRGDGEVKERAPNACPSQVYSLVLLGLLHFNLEGLSRRTVPSSTLSERTVVYILIGPDIVFVRFSTFITLFTILLFALLRREAIAFFAGAFYSPVHWLCRTGKLVTVMSWSTGIPHYCSLRPRIASSSKVNYICVSLLRD